MKSPLNKYLYILFILLGLYQALFTKDYLQAAASMGIGLAFDPFDTEQSWGKRPLWQKAVLFIQLALAFVFLGIGLWE